MEHILIRCSFSQQIWWQILQRLGFNSITPGTDTLQEWWMQLRGQLSRPKRKRFRLALRLNYMAIVEGTKCPGVPRDQVTAGRAPEDQGGRRLDLRGRQAARLFVQCVID